VILDIAVAVLLLVLALGLAIISISYATAFGGLTAECGAGSYPGLECNATALGIAAYGLLAVAIVGLFAGAGMVVVRIIQKRYTVLWALGTVVLLYAAFFVATWLAGQTVPTS
jgi:hypothetical protein